MLHAGGKLRYFEIQDRSATEPCSKRIKSAEELDGKSYDGLQRLHEEVHIKKTHSGFIPLSLSDDYYDETTKQEEKDTGEVLDPFNTATVDKISKSSNSLSNIEVTGSKRPLSTASAPVEKERKDLVQKNHSKVDSALYSTSKVFIGPIYKNEGNRQHNEKNKSIGHSCQNMSNTTLGGRSEKKMPQQALHCHVPKIEDELSLFYSEIDQLESNENCLDGHLQATETNSHGQPAEYNKLNQPFPANSQEWSSRIPPSWNDGLCSYTNSDGHNNMGNEQYGSSDPPSYRSRNEQFYNNQKAIWEIEQLCHKEEGSRFLNNYVPEFVPSQQRTHPFITPYGPPPPQYTTHLNLQVPNSSFHSATFCPPNVGPFKNVPINMNRSASQNSEYISHFDNYCGQTSRNSCNVPDRHVVNGFCETPANWKDVNACWTEGPSTDSQWFSKNRLCESQKLLIILRGLPGAGKTTLSHVLLGHRCDGIIFSTDDYFCENNGRWSYNIAQLGAAHDWNQKRAKQAMDEGRSPIIIDNTNTQAWEMKPYVEAALEKGYQVEFHEPDTWWKFIPEELEKRNKHGVSLEKIAQMLERYEYHMSIPIVMNSLLPFHKTSPRPPPERRQRQLVAKKQDKFYKTKQRRKRKRNKKSKSVATKVIEKNSGGNCNLSDEGSSQSGLEGLEDDGKTGFATGHLNEHKEESEDGFAKDIGLKHSELLKGAFLDSSMMDPVTSGNSVNTNVLVRNSDLCLMSLSPATDGNVTEQSFRHSLTNVAQSLNSGENESNGLEFNNQSALKLNHSGKDNGNTVRRTEDEDKAAGVVVELGVESNLLSNKEVIVLHQHGISQNTKINTWAFFSIDMVEKQQQMNADKNECLIWPEDTSVIIHNQRLKKERNSKQIFPETKGELIDYKSSQKLVECGDGEMLLEKNVVRGYAVPSLLMANSCNMLCIAVGDLTESRTKASVPSDVTKLVSSRKKERCKRIFKLAPNFDIPRQVPVKNDGMIKDVDVLVEQQGISNKGTKKKQNLDCYGHSASSTYDTVMVQMSMSAYCKISLPGEQQIVPLNQTIEANTGGKQDKISPDVSTTQPDVLSSIKEIAGCLIDSTMETLGSLQQLNQTEQTVYSQARDYQNPLSNTSKFWWLPLSLRFAVQLVEHFGSPGVPLDTLLPDDYVVPLDWATSKQMYLHWKTSVEKKQKNSISKGDSALPVGGVTILEDSNKEGQERQEPYEVNL